MITPICEISLWGLWVKEEYENPLDEECSAMKSPREIREASHKLGTIFKIFIEEG